MKGVLNVHNLKPWFNQCLNARFNDFIGSDARQALMTYRHLGQASSVTSVAMAPRCTPPMVNEGVSPFWVPRLDAEFGFRSQTIISYITCLSTYKTGVFGYIGFTSWEMCNVCYCVSRMQFKLFEHEGFKVNLFLNEAAHNGIWTSPTIHTAQSGPPETGSQPTSLFSERKMGHITSPDHETIAGRALMGHCRHVTSRTAQFPKVKSAHIWGAKLGSILAGRTFGGPISPYCPHVEIRFPIFFVRQNLDFFTRIQLLTHVQVGPTKKKRRQSVQARPHMIVYG